MIRLHRRRLRPRALAPGRYLTDGRQLLRVLSRFDDGRSVMVLVEDCRTFEAHAYAMLELRAMRFRGLRERPQATAVETAPAKSSLPPLGRFGQLAG
jgi:hypothetical protein